MPSWGWLMWCTAFLYLPSQQNHTFSVWHHGHKHTQTVDTHTTHTLSNIVKTHSQKDTHRASLASSGRSVQCTAFLFTSLRTQEYTHTEWDRGQTPTHRQMPLACHHLTGHWSAQCFHICPSWHRTRTNWTRPWTHTPQTDTQTDIHTPPACHHRADQCSVQRS